MTETEGLDGMIVAFLAFGIMSGALAGLVALVAGAGLGGVTLAYTLFGFLGFVAMAAFHAYSSSNRGHGALSSGAAPSPGPAPGR